MKGEAKLHYGWIVIFMGLLTTIAAHGFGRMKPHENDDPAVEEFTLSFHSVSPILSYLL